MRDTKRARVRLWRVLVPVTALGAGLMFATSASLAQGTDLRAGRFSQLTDLIMSTQSEVAREEQAAKGLRSAVDRQSQLAAIGSSSVGAEQAKGNALVPAAGLQSAAGPGLTVSLNDAPRPKDGQPPLSTNPDDLVVHQQDVQSVVNALWAGGADAITLMGDRIISTSAVQCVGNTLLIQGRLVGPPFVIKAIGNPVSLRSALNMEPGVALFLRYVQDYGLSFDVSSDRTMHLPAYAGPLDLAHVDRTGS